jgi:HD-GYP domain-containing protein (c-di-GMP phosphodiesterase class II)
MVDDGLRLADILAALSVATDLGMGQEPEKAVRSCLVATHLARACDLPEPAVRDVFYTTLLQHLGCTAPAHEWSYLFGDGLATSPQAERTDGADRQEALALLISAGRGMGVRRFRHLARTVAAGKQGSRTVLLSVCEVGARMSERLGLGEGVRLGLLHNMERWDGGGEAYRLAGDDIALPARFAPLATQAVIFDRLGGPDAALEMVRRRAGGWFDPAVTTTFERVGPDLLGRLAETDVWAEVLEAEPRPARRLAPTRLDDVARAFADMVDLLTPFTLGHSAGVAEFAEAAAQRLRLPAGSVDRLRRAALLHDLGRVAIAGAVWEKPRALSSTEWEQVRLHPYYTERILVRSAILEPMARIAGMHHERQDGSGYHHGASAAQVPAEARLLAVADAYQAMTQDRPYRAALPARGGSGAGRGGSSCRLVRPRVRQGGYRGGRPAPDPGPKRLAGGPFRARNRGAAAGGAWTVQPPDRRHARHFIPHRRAPRPAHLYEDRSVHACRRGDVRHGAWAATLTTRSRRDRRAGARAVTGQHASNA